jgi:hypothetical protein
MSWTKSNLIRLKTGLIELTLNFQYKKVVYLIHFITSDVTFEAVNLLFGIHNFVSNIKKTSLKYVYCIFKLLWKNLPNFWLQVQFNGKEIFFIYFLLNERYIFLLLININ